MGAKQSSSGDLAVEQRGEATPGSESSSIRRTEWSRPQSARPARREVRPLSATFSAGPDRRRRNRDSAESVELDLGGLPLAWEPQSLPTTLGMLRFDRGIKCPVCSKKLQSDIMESHLAECLTKPRLNYNENKLTADMDDECVICFEDMSEGQRVARLPCLCVYHKRCIDKWFEVSRCCPAHPETSSEVDISSLS